MDGAQMSQDWLLCNYLSWGIDSWGVYYPILSISIYVSTFEIFLNSLNNLCLFTDNFLTDTEVSDFFLFSLPLNDFTAIRM